MGILKRSLASEGRLCGAGVLVALRLKNPEPELFFLGAAVRIWTPEEEGLED